MEIGFAASESCDQGLAHIQCPGKIKPLILFYETQQKRKNSLKKRRSLFAHKEASILYMMMVPFCHDSWIFTFFLTFLLYY
jgi:hypothetical protein